MAEIRAALGGGPFVFNLGHGILPQTPPEHVAELARLLAEPAAASRTGTRADVTRRAVVLMNLGGPDSPDAVRPFLYNLFSDTAIIRLPAPLRLPLAALIASRRAADRAARSMPSSAAPRRCSPIRRRRRARSKRELGAGPSLLYRDALLAPADRGGGVRGQAMDAGRDRAAAALSAILDDDDAILARRLGARGDSGSASTRRPDASAPIPTRPVLSRRSRPRPATALDAARAETHPIRLLFSAHGLPEKIVRSGDPYPREVATTAAALLRALARRNDQPG